MAAGQRRYIYETLGSGKWWVRDGHTATASESAKADIGARVRAAREALGLKSAELAKMTGRNPSSISDIERGKGSFSLGFLLQVAEALGIEPAALFPATREGEYAKGYRHGYLEAISRLQNDIPEG